MRDSLEKSIKEQWSRWFEQLKIPCDICGGSGFHHKYGWADICECSGGYIGLYEPQELIQERDKLLIEIMELKQALNEVVERHTT